MSDADYGTVRHGSDPDEPPLNWFVTKRHGHSADATQRLMRLRVKFFRRWLNDELSWIIYNDDDQDTIEEKRDEWGEEILQHEREVNWTTGGDLRPETLSIDDALDYFQALSACPRYSGSAEESHVKAIRQFYEFTLNRGHSWFTSTGNPIELALNEGGDKIIGSQSSRNPEIIPVGEMGEYIRSFQHPLWETVTAMMAKTTIRRGVTHNLDLQDVFLDHPACDWDVNRELRHKDQPFLYISSEPEEGKLWEERHRVPKASNKTSVDRTIPIDDELRDLFLRWLTVHPGPLKSDTPLFVSLYRNWGERIHAQTVQQKIRDHSEELGYWYEAYDDDNINPHYFRHWSTSVIDQRLEVTSTGGHATTTKLLRGDEEDTMDNYTHWSEDRIERYLDVTPSFYD
jgi:integrase